MDRKRGIITLSADPSNPYGAVVIGRLQKNPDLDVFFINSGRAYDSQVLLKVLRFNSHWVIGGAERIIGVLSDLKVSSINSFQDSKNQKGDVKKSFSKVVTSDIPESFILSIPLFTGMPADQFRVEVFVEATDGGVRFFLESYELPLAIERRTAFYVDAEVDLFKDKVLVVYKN